MFDIVKQEKTNSEVSSGHVIKHRFVGSGQQNISPDKPYGIYNFLTGNQQSQWRSGVQGFKELQISNIYPNIYAKYYFNNSDLKYDIVVLPQADPTKIQFTYDGASQPIYLRNYNRTKPSELVITTSVGEIVERIPECYQTINGKKVNVNIEFLVQGNLVSFKLGEYDNTKNLVIDPAITLNSYLGGSGDEYGRAVTIDTLGNVYVTGVTNSANFPVTLGAYNTKINSTNSTNDIFVSKLNRNATSLIYSTFVGGSANDEVTGIKVRKDGSAVVCGYTNSGNFPKINTIQPKKSGSDGIIFALSPDGGSIKFSTFLGSNSNDEINDIYLDNKDTIFVVGATNSQDFPTKINSLQPLYKGLEEGFVTKISPLGDSMIQSTFLGGSLRDKAIALCAAKNGEICVTGTTNSVDFATSANSYRASKLNPLTTDMDCFFVRLSRNLALQSYSTYFGGTNEDKPSVLSADSLNNVYVSGWTVSLDFPYTQFGGGGGNWFLSKFSNNFGVGSLVYCVKVGNISSSEASTVQTDAQGNAIVCGSDNNGFRIIKYDINGNSGPIISVTKNFVDVARGSALSEYNDFYFCGTTNVPDLLIPGLPAYDSVLNNNSSNQNYDAFVMRYSFNKRPFSVYPTERNFPTLTCDTIAFDTIYVENQGEEDLLILKPYFLNDDGFFKIVFPTNTGVILLGPKTRLKIIVQFSTRYNADKTAELVLLTNEGNNLNLTSKENRIKYSARRVAPLIEYFNAGLFKDIIFPAEAFCNSTQTKDTSLLIRNPGLDSVTVTSLRMASGRNFRLNTSRQIPARLGSQRTMPLTITRIISEIGTQFGLYQDTAIVEIKECNGELRIPVQSKMDSVTFGLISKDTLKFNELDVCNGVISDTQKVSIENKGRVPIWLDSAVFGDTHFKILEPLPLIIMPDQTQEIKVIYTFATGDTPINTTLRLVSKPCAFDIKLTIITKGIKYPVNPPSIFCDFKKFTYCKNDDYTDTLVTFTNISNVILNVMPSQPKSNFVILEPTQYPVRLLPKDTMKIKIRFIPSGIDSFRADFKFPFASGTCSDTLTVTGVGKSFTPSLAAKEINLGIMESCKPTVDSTFYVYNSFPQEIIIDSLKSVKGWVREHKVPIQIKPEDSIKIDFHFAPDATGILTDTILIYSSQPCVTLLRVAITTNKFGNVLKVNENQLLFPTTLSCGIVKFSEKVVEIINSSVTGEGNAVTVSSVKIYGSPAFKIYPDTVGQQIKINDTLRFLARLEATVAGQYSAEAEIVFSPCNDTLRIKMFGAIEPALLPFSQPPILQPVFIGDTGQTAATIVNSTSTDIRVDSVSGVIPPFRIIGITPMPPFIMKNRDSIKIDFEFVPTASGNSATIVKVFYSEPCSFSTDIRLSAEGIVRPQEFDLCIGGQYSALIGDEFDIPIKITSQNPISSSLEGKFFLNFDKKNLAVINNFPPNTSYQTLSKGGVISFNNLKSAATILTKIRFIALLGEHKDFTPFVRLDSVALTESTLIPHICSDTAFINIGNRCILSGTKLGDGRNYLLKPTPNPASSVLELKFGQLESTFTTIKIVDVSGNEVFTPLNKVFNEGGDYDLKIPSLNLPSGIYYIILQAGEYQASQVLHVNK